MSAFEKLGLRVGLVVSDEEVREAFRVRGAVLHPDGGGDEERFAELREAQEILLSPARRLGEWMRCMGLEVDKRGEIGGEMMKIFQRVADVGNEGEALIQEGAGLSSALARAMWEVRMMKVRERVKELLEIVKGEIEGREAEFGGVECGEVDAGKVMRDLIFLEKWREGLRKLFGKLM